MDEYLPLDNYFRLAPGRRFSMEENYILENSDREETTERPPVEIAHIGSDRTRRTLLELDNEFLANTLSDQEI